MRFSVSTLGCKVNQYEAQAIGSIIASHGHSQVVPGLPCDAYIINTCTVTSESARKSRQAVRRARRQNPDALIAVCGCLSQLEPAAIEKLEVDLIGGSGNRVDFANEVLRLMDERQKKLTDEKPVTDVSHDKSLIVLPTDTKFEKLPPGAAPGRTRALLKIQDGCDNNCTYCVIPQARGKSRSLPVVRAAEYARKLDAQGFREIVVTGIEISSYGKEIAGKRKLRKLAHEDAGAGAADFADLDSVKELEGSDAHAETHADPHAEAASPQKGKSQAALAVDYDTKELAGIIRVISGAAPNARLRLGSLDPGVLTTDFCDALKDLDNLCDHFHLSLQSGCDDVLRRMGRKYNTDIVNQAIYRLRSRFPNCGITADLIVGFPGETETEFMQTLGFIRAERFSGMHVFPFSPRQGTSAAAMPDQVLKQVRFERAKAVAAVAADMAMDFKLRQIGKTLNVLFERDVGDRHIGLSGNYVEVAVFGFAVRNTIHPVLVTGLSGSTVIGEISDN